MSFKKGIPHTEEVKKKISEACMGRVPWNKGMSWKTNKPAWNKGLSGRSIHTEEYKEQLSKRMAGNTYRKGKTSHQKGKPLSDEQKMKISKSRQGKYTGENHPMFGKHHSEETKAKISKSRMGKGGQIGSSNPMYGMTGDKHPLWQGGISFMPYCHKFNNTLKEQIRNRDDRTCQLCGKKEIDNGRRLDVHHIHYDKDNCEPDLIALCNGCNSKVNINRDYYENLFMEKLKCRGLSNFTD